MKILLLLLVFLKHSLNDHFSFPKKCSFLVLWFCLGSLPLSVSAASTPCSSSSLVWDWDAFQAALNDQEWRLAECALDARLAVDPNDSEAVLGRGLWLWRQGLAQATYAWMQRVYAHHPTNADMAELYGRSWVAVMGPHDAWHQWVTAGRERWGTTWYADAPAWPLNLSESSAALPASSPHQWQVWLGWEAVKEREPWKTVGIRREYRTVEHSWGMDAGWHQRFGSTNVQVKGDVVLKTANHGAWTGSLGISDALGQGAHYLPEYQGSLGRSQAWSSLYGDIRYGWSRYTTAIVRQWALSGGWSTQHGDGIVGMSRSSVNGVSAHSYRLAWVVPTQRWGLSPSIAWGDDTDVEESGRVQLLRFENIALNWRYQGKRWQHVFALSHTRFPDSRTPARWGFTWTMAWPPR